MPCSLATTLANACDSGIGREADPVKLLQLIAQNFATAALAANPANPVTLSAIQARACTSGIGKLTDENALWRIIAQNLCNQIT